MMDKRIDDWQNGIVVQTKVTSHLNKLKIVIEDLDVKKRIWDTFYWAFLVKCKLFKGYVEVKSANYWESVEVKSENITYYSK